MARNFITLYHYVIRNNDIIQMRYDNINYDEIYITNKYNSHKPITYFNFVLKCNNGKDILLSSEKITGRDKTDDILLKYKNVKNSLRLKKIKILLGNEHN